jgi:hypothetical protein
VSWHVTGVIYYHIPVAVAQCIELAVSIADQRFDLWEKRGVAFAAVEQRQRMSASTQGFDEMRPNETRTA